MKKYIVFIVLSVVIFSCKPGDRRKSLLPNPTGKAGEITVIMNQEKYKGETGIALQKVMMSEYPALPQSEPMFNLINLPHESFSSLSKRFRNIIVVKKGNSNKNEILVRKDVWASPQTVVYISGKTYPEIRDVIKKNKTKLTSVFESAEYDIMLNYNEKHAKRSIKSRLKKKFNINLNVPPGYDIDVDSTNFVWIANETPRTSQGIFIYTYPYTSQDMFSVSKIVEKRNKMLKKYVEGPSAGSYMTTETLFPPLESSYYKDSTYVYELRGLWKVENDFMGGPFISYSIYDAERSRIIALEGYVYAGKLNKRNYLRQVDAVLRSVKIVNDEPEGDKQ